MLNSSISFFYIPACQNCRGDIFNLILFRKIQYIYSFYTRVCIYKRWNFMSNKMAKTLDVFYFHSIKAFPWPDVNKAILLEGALL